MMPFDMNQLSRREFVALTAGGAAAAPLASIRQTVLYAAAGLTAQDVVDRIKKNVGIEWRAETVDTFKAGDPATVVTGVVTTSMATLAVLRLSVKAGANLIITSGPTFYGRADAPNPAVANLNDPIFAAKNELIETERLVLCRFSDHWRARTPEPLVQGLRDAFGWSRFTAADDPARVSIPATTLGALASTIKKKLNARGGIRVVGDPRTAIRKVALIRLGAVTHSDNMEQRYVPLAFTAGATRVTATGPANANIAPPGPYMLVIVDDKGVPSVASMISVQGSAAPTVAPRPGSTASRPAGTPACRSSSTKASAVNGVCSAGLSTTPFPPMRAGASLCATRLRGSL